MTHAGGLDAEGIFRVPGSNSALDDLKDALDYGYPIDFSIHKDPHTFGSLVKAFLRELPDPILTMERYDDFIKSSTGIFCY